MAEPFRWSAEDTTPGAVDAALRSLLEARHAESGTYAPARVLNLVAVIDREFRGEIQNRLERVGRYHPSRTIVCAVERGRTTMDAWATMSGGESAAAGEITVGEERVELTLGEQHVQRLETIVDPLLVPDLETLVWSPHGHPDALDALAEVTDVVLIDSIAEPDPVAAIARALERLRSAYVVDLAWIRSAPWRERIAASFDPPRWRRELDRISSVTVRHHPDSVASGGMILGWLASRLDWEPARMDRDDGALAATARKGDARVALSLAADASMSVPGLSGITIETADGMCLSLDRGSGGLAARRTQPARRETSWAVLGASRGEAGILGEGIRQALLRDPTYGPALRGACAMLS